MIAIGGMALMVNEPVMFYSQQTPVNPAPPLKGVVIAAPPSPIIIWDGGVSATYTAVAAPTGVIRLAAAGADPAALKNWMGELVEPDPAQPSPVANPSGRMRGVVVDVVNALEPVPVPALLIVRTSDGYYAISATLVRKVIG